MITLYAFAVQACLINARLTANGDDKAYGIFPKVNLLNVDIITSNIFKIFTLDKQF